MRGGSRCGSTAPEEAVAMAGPAVSGADGPPAEAPSSGVASGIVVLERFRALEYPKAAGVSSSKPGVFDALDLAFEQIRHTLLCEIDFPLLQIKASCDL